MDDIKLTDLISVETLQRVQDGFSNYTGMASITTDRTGSPVTKGSGFTVFCTELTRKSELGCKNCELCDRDGALKTLVHKRATVYRCHAGLFDFAAPIMVNDIFLGSFVGGQVRAEEVSEKDLMQIAIRYGINPDVYIAAAKATKCLSYEEIEKAAFFLEDIAKSLSSIAYDSYLSIKKSKKIEEAAKSQADFMMNACEEMEKSLCNWFNIVEDKISTTNNQEVHDILSKMQKDGTVMRNDIKDTVDFIRLSNKKVNLSESVYKISSFVKAIKSAIANSGFDPSIPISVGHGSFVSDEMFGDSGYIAQIINKIIRGLLTNKKTGKICLTFSSEKIGYTTFLIVKIVDIDTAIKQEEIDEGYNNFRNVNPWDISANSDRVSTYIGSIIQKMSGKITVEKDEKDLVIEIKVPQISI